MTHLLIDRRRERHRHRSYCASRSPAAESARSDDALGAAVRGARGSAAASHATPAAKHAPDQGPSHIHQVN